MINLIFDEIFDEKVGQIIGVTNKPFSKFKYTILNSQWNIETQDDPIVRCVKLTVFCGPFQTSLTGDIII